jgi:hypothetical protein
MVSGVNIPVIELASVCEIRPHAFCIALRAGSLIEAPALEALLLSHRLAKAHPVKPVPIENL